MPSSSGVKETIVLNESWREDQKMGILLNMGSQETLLRADGIPMPPIVLKVCFAVKDRLLKHLRRCRDAIEPARSQAAATRCWTGVDAACGAMTGRRALRDRKDFKKLLAELAAGAAKQK
jgi:hypothetical protein